jgi:hypothetical protein
MELHAQVNYVSNLFRLKLLLLFSSTINIITINANANNAAGRKDGF